MELIGLRFFAGQLSRLTYKSISCNFIYRILCANKQRSETALLSTRREVLPWKRLLCV